MSQIARALLLKLLAQADRGGRITLPIGERSAHAYFTISDLTERDALHALSLIHISEPCLLYTSPSPRD